MLNGNVLVRLNQNKAIGQVIAIFFIQACYSTAFAVFYSGLSLYLTHNKNFTQQSASSLTGLFLSLNYFLPLIGGAIATRYISYKKLFLLGILSSFIGCILLMKDCLYLGLSFFIMAGLSSVCLNIFLTQLFSDDQKIQRRTAFVWNYSGMNLGFMLGYFLTGITTLNNHYYVYLFGLMSCLIIVSLCITSFFVKEPRLNREINTPALRQFIMGTLIMAFSITIITIMFLYADFLHGKITLFTITTMGIIIFLALKSANPDNRSHLVKFISFLLLTIIFWSFYMLTPIVIMQLIESRVERHYFNITMAPQWLTNLNSIVILMFAPLLTLLMKSGKILNNSESYFTIGFFLLFLGFLLMAIGIHVTGGQTKIPALVMIGYLTLLAFGEIFISPISDSFVGEYIQESLRGVMAGISRVTICIGVLFAGILANKFVLPHINRGGFTFTDSIKLERFFLGCGLVSLIIAFAIPLILIMIKRQRKMLTSYI